jgi:hypothetical protein
MIVLAPPASRVVRFGMARSATLAQVGPSAPMYRRPMLRENPGGGKSGAWW